jgi:RNA polymerase sigma-70 factor (ECF subfamily)
LRWDTRAFALIIKNTGKLIAQIVFKMVPVAEDRKDLAQDMYMKHSTAWADLSFNPNCPPGLPDCYNPVFLDRKEKPVLPGNFYEPEAWQNHSTETSDNMQRQQ